jgi:hypothetical protein
MKPIVMNEANMNAAKLMRLIPGASWSGPQRRPFVEFIKIKLSLDQYCESYAVLE